MPAKPGDRVRVIAKDEIKEGILMPNEETDSVVIKLDSGYNVGIDQDRVTEIKLLESLKERKAPEKAPLKKDTKKPTIAILHTGGTIASKVDYKTGGVIASFSDDDLISMFPEIKDIANIKTTLVSNMMSEDMRFSNYQLLAKAVETEIKNKADGIIIGHGTDTLAVTSAALAFIFESLPIPVILVGSQRSTDRGSTDAAANLVCAAEFIAKSDFAGVAICMHESTSDSSCLILPATKTKKLHTSRRDAFKPVNDKAIARVDFGTRKIDFLKDDYARKSDKKLIVRDKFEEKVAVLRTYNGMSHDFFDVLAEKKYKGLVLEGTGIGHAPTNTEENLPNYKSLKKLVDSGCVVVLTSQCIFGRIHQDIYTNTRRLKDMGILSGEDMLTDTALIKLAWLLGNYKKEEVKELMTKNLRGEINERLMEDEFLG